MGGKSFLYVAIAIFYLSTSCDNTLQCEKHFIPHNFTGKVAIYFNQKDGQKEFDKENCIVFKIGEDGKCFTELPFKVGTVYPGKTIRYFEVVNKDSLNELFGFNEAEYLKDVVNNENKKYIFFGSSGYIDPYYTVEYNVDYGKNSSKYAY